MANDAEKLNPDLSRFFNRANEIYSNCAIYYEDNLICRCSYKRVIWYLKRNLADIRSESPLHITLRFRPKLVVREREQFYSEKKENLCVVCGNSDLSQLSRHHIVPSCFRKFFPDEYKCYMSHDVVPVCRPCHDKYHTKTSGIIAEMLNSREDIIKIRLRRKKARKVLNACSALTNYIENLPQKRQMELRKIISSWGGNDIIGEGEIELVAKQCIEYLEAKESMEAKLFVEGLSDLGSFIVFWRQDFVKTMRPKFLQDGWDINNRVKASIE